MEKSFNSIPVAENPTAVALTLHIRATITVGRLPVCTLNEASYNLSAGGDAAW
jgi:hypothetical protein